MTTVTAETHKIPAELWGALQTISYEQDKRFLRDVAKITGISEKELKQSLLGRFGMPTTVLVETGPWWMGSTCHFMERRPLGDGFIWHPCGGYREACGACGKHTRSRPTAVLKRKDDPYFKSLPQCTPARLGGDIVWVRADKSVLSAEGQVLPMQIDITQGVAYTCAVEKD
jgi:hypothetical protein